MAIRLLLLMSFSLVMLSCSMDEASVGAPDSNTGGVSYKSPIPLCNGNRIELEHVTYDQNGETILSIDTVAVIVSGPIRNVGDIILADTFRTFIQDGDGFLDDDTFYSYQWEGERKGSILRFLQPEGEDEIARGLSVVASYSYDSSKQLMDTVLLDSPRILLPFPANVGAIGDVYAEDSTDTTKRFELMDLNKPFLMASGYSVHTHCYRTGSEENYEYHYYEIDRGLVAMLVYENGKRVKSLKRI